MSGTEFLSDPESLLDNFASLCDWADQITVCTPRIDAGDGYEILQRNIGKVRLCLVSERAAGLATLAPFQAKGALRLVGDLGLRFHPNVYVFRRGTEVRALVGSARLSEDGLGSGLESVVHINVTQDDPLACSLADFVESCLTRSRVPSSVDLIEGTLAPGHLTPVCDARVGSLSPLEDVIRIRSSQAKLWTVIQATGTRLRVDLGRRQVAASWHPSLGFWAVPLKGVRRYWTIFGTGDPRKRKPPLISFVLCIPKHGCDPAASGAFAMEPKERRFLVHRGGFGGRGRAGRRLFWRSTRLRGAELVENGRPSRVALVAELDSPRPRILEQLAAYVHEVARVKTLAHRPTDDSVLGDDRDGRERQEFTEIQDSGEQDAVVWFALLGSGPLPKDEAVRRVTHYLREQGQAEFQRLDSSGPLYTAILDSIERGARSGLFDRPTRGFIRAVLASAQEYPDWLWQWCVLAVLEQESMSRDDVIRRAAAWAVENVGLQHHRLRRGGKVDQGLRRALSREIRRGNALTEGRDLVRLADEP
jgi:hypothetical protein